MQFPLFLISLYPITSHLTILLSHYLSSHLYHYHYLTVFHYLYLSSHCIPFSLISLCTIIFHLTTSPLTVYYYLISHCLKESFGRPSSPSSRNTPTWGATGPFPASFSDSMSQAFLQLNINNNIVFVSDFSVEVRWRKRMARSRKTSTRGIFLQTILLKTPGLSLWISLAPLIPLALTLSPFSSTLRRFLLLLSLYLIKYLNSHTLISIIYAYDFFLVTR